MQQQVDVALTSRQDEPKEAEGQSCVSEQCPIHILTSSPTHREVTQIETGFRHLHTRTHDFERRNLR